MKYINSGLPALREALSNAIIHGNRLDPRKPVRIGVSVQDGCGMLNVVKDSGSGFDPAQLATPRLANTCSIATWC